MIWDEESQRYVSRPKVLADDDEKLDMRPGSIHYSNPPPADYEPSEWFRGRMAKLDRDHEARMAEIRRADRRMFWILGLIFAGWVLAEILMAVLR